MHLNTFKTFYKCLWLYTFTAPLLISFDHIDKEFLDPFGFIIPSWMCTQSSRWGAVCSSTVSLPEGQSMCCSWVIWHTAAFSPLFPSFFTALTLFLMRLQWTVHGSTEGPASFTSLLFSWYLKDMTLVFIYSTKYICEMLLVMKR